MVHLVRKKAQACIAGKKETLFCLCCRTPSESANAGRAEPTAVAAGAVAVVTRGRGPPASHLYLAIAVNRSEFTRLMNLRSSVSNLIFKLPLSESTATLSNAIFSVGVAFIFLYKMPACSSDESVAAVKASEVLTLRLNFTPLLKSIL